MDDDSYSRRKKSIDALAERINLGISENGIHVIDGNDLALIWDHHQPVSDDERRLHVKNFAHAYGFNVHVSSWMQVAIFRKSS